MLNSQVESVVDVICHRGCRYVNAVLQDSDQRQHCAEFNALNHRDQQLVLAELSAVMAVYDETGSCDVFT